MTHLGTFVRTPMRVALARSTASPSVPRRASNDGAFKLLDINTARIQ
jgi:hypothetical protein